MLQPMLQGKEMFVLKKIIPPFLLPPGIVICLLFVCGFWLFLKKKRKLSFFIIMMGALLWFVSMAPVSNFLLRGLEAEFENLPIPNGDAIILLGGGVNGYVTDMTGIGRPSDMMLGRMVTAVRLQRRLNIPLIVSGGKIYKDSPIEAVIVRRFLLDLGIAPEYIIVEEKSRDTWENALFTRQICESRGFVKPILITSAYHMRRALLSFQKVELSVTPYPTAFKSTKNIPYRWSAYLPRASSLSATAVVMHEYLGLLFYYLFY